LQPAKFLKAEKKLEKGNFVTYRSETYLRKENEKQKTDRQKGNLQNLLSI